MTNESRRETVSLTAIGWLLARLTVAVLGVGMGCFVPLSAPGFLVSWAFLIWVSAFFFGAAYPLVSAFLMTRMPSYGREPWGRLSLLSNPFRARGPHHFTQILIMFLVGAFSGNLIVLSSDWSYAPAPGTFVDLLYFSTIMLFAAGLIGGIMAANNIFHRAYLSPVSFRLAEESGDKHGRVVAALWIGVILLPLFWIGLAAVMILIMRLS